MTANPEKQQQNLVLTLLDNTGSPIQFLTVASIAILQDKGRKTVQLILSISLEQLQNLEAAALFHLKPELRGPLSGKDFTPESPIEITLSLNPQLLQLLPNQNPTSSTVVEHLSTLSQNLNAATPEPESSPHTSAGIGNEPVPEAEVNEHTPHLSPLLLAENWFALQVNQQQDTGETGYRTLWFYVPSDTLSQEITSNGQVSEALGRYFQDGAETDWTAISETVDELLQDLESWTHKSFLPAAEDAISGISDAIAQTFETWLEEAQPEERSFNSKNTHSQKPIYQTMLNFFTEDDWGFTKLRGESTLQLAFQGEHGQWNCYALARDEQAQFIFYSICPVIAEIDRRPAIAEFIARANYGLIPGNFELDFDSGEIRYKTSFDATQIAIQLSVIQRLVYANVSLMDRYLPGIRAVLEQAISPKDAIRKIEESKAE